MLKYILRENKLSIINVNNFFSYYYGLTREDKYYYCWVCLAVGSIIEQLFWFCQDNIQKIIDKFKNTCYTNF